MLPQVSTFPRFWSKVSIGAPNDCWLWIAQISLGGYGVFWFENRGQSAHRVVYKLLIGPIPEGLSIDHLCRVRRCVNPHHLEPVTQKENALRGVSPWARNAHKTHCPQGHVYNQTNTRIVAGSRYCRECGRARCRSYYRRKKQEMA